MNGTDLKQDIDLIVSMALEEDIGQGDVTAALIPATEKAGAQVICRQHAVICGVDWVNAVFAQVDSRNRLNWLVGDGDEITPDSVVFTVEGYARSILTSERSALNFLQTLSATATISRYFANLVKHTQVKLLDTRKTLPGLRKAQKYAVACGGCHNHRIGLYDAFLIKENHILACGSIEAAVSRARRLHNELVVEVEVENLDELHQAIAARADVIMLDEFSLEDIATAVSAKDSDIRLEASGGISDEQQLIAVAETGVDYISIGALTKNCKAVDLSMRLVG